MARRLVNVLDDDTQKLLDRIDRRMKKYGKMNMGQLFDLLETYEAALEKLADQSDNNWTKKLAQDALIGR